jgi:hypothetical protein
MVGIECPQFVTVVSRCGAIDIREQPPPVVVIKDNRIGSRQITEQLSFFFPDVWKFLTFPYLYGFVLASLWAHIYFSFKFEDVRKGQMIVRADDRPVRSRLGPFHLYDCDFSSFGVEFIFLEKDI